MKRILSGILAASLLFNSVLGINYDEVNAESLKNTVFINEICAKNTTYSAENGEFYDYIELYNCSDEFVDISSYGLSDKPSKPFKYLIPEGTGIESHGHLIIFCDSDYSLVNPAVAAFSLGTSGGKVLLTAPDEETIDKIEYPLLNSDVGYGRVPDGSSFLSKIELSPGIENKDEDVILDPPAFSHDGGFYNEGFDLNLSAPENCKIYYTLDGSTPTAESLCYDGPIFIDDVSSKPNEISMITDISTYNYSGPDYNIDKAVVINALSIDSNGRASEIVSNTYYIGFDKKADYYNNFTVISLITDKNNLFDYEKGIYVKGKVYNNWLNSSEYDSSTAVYWMPANYHQEGSSWERESVIQVYDQGQLCLSQKVGIRIHGGATRAFYQKSFNIYARSMYGGSKLQYDFFNGLNLSEYDNSKIKKYDSIILRNSGNDTRKTRFRDKLNQQLSAGKSFSVQAMKPCILFINGEYWGQYEMTEKISDYYIQSHYDVDADNVCIIKNGVLEDGPVSGRNDYNELTSWIKDSSVNLENDESYRYLCSKIDIQNYIEYMCSNIYFNNRDWGANNVALWKSTEIDDTNEFADEKWRLMMFDTEFSSGCDDNSLASANMFSSIRKDNNFIFNIYKKATKNEKFKNQFYNTFMDMANDNFSSDYVNSEIDKLEEEYHQSTMDLLDRFYYGKYNNEESYSSEVKKLRDFYTNRFAYITKYLKSDLGLTGKLVNVNIENLSESGNITLNTITPDTSTGTWSGKYFTDYPVTITANPNEGHDFSYFQLSNGKRIFTPTAEIKLDSDITIEAVYDEFIENTEVVAGNIKISGDIGVNLYTKISPEVKSNPEAYIQILVNGKEMRKIGVQTLSSEIYNGEECCIVNYNLNSNQMNDTVDVQIYSDENVSKPYSFRLNDIIEKYMEQTDPSFSDIKTLLNSLSSYGSYASQYFNQTALNVSEETKTAISAITPDDMISSKSITTGKLPDGIKYYGSSLVLESKTAIRHYFRLDSGKSISSYTFTTPDDTRLIPVKKSDLYYIEIPDIAATRLGTAYEVKCGDFTISYSALSYVYSVLSKNKAGTELQDLLKSIYLYYKEADTYAQKN